MLVDNLWWIRRTIQTHNLELAEVVFVLKIWIHYLYGVHVHLFSNYKSLQYVFTQKELSLCKRRCLKFLKDYYMSVHYHPDKPNLVADALLADYLWVV